MEEYIDVFSDKYTKMWKTIAIVKLFIRLLFVICITITIVLVAQGMIPYIKGYEEWEEMPWTLSQFEALFCLLVFFWMGIKAMRMIQ